MQNSTQFILITLGFLLTLVLAFYVNAFVGVALFAICVIFVALAFMGDLWLNSENMKD